MNRKRTFLTLLALAFLGCAWAQQNVAVGDIYCTDGTTVKPESYAGSGKTPECIVFSVDNQDHFSIISLGETSAAWDSKDNPSPVDGYPITSTTMERRALSDMNGLRNTVALMWDAKSSQHDAAQYCFNLNYPVGHSFNPESDTLYATNWYMPSAGQLNTIIKNVAALNASIDKIGLRAASIATNEPYWSSTEWASDDGTHIGDTR